MGRLKLGRLPLYWHIAKMRACRWLGHFWRASAAVCAFCGIGQIALMRKDDFDEGGIHARLMRCVERLSQWSRGNIKSLDEVREVSMYMGSDMFIIAEWLMRRRAEWLKAKK